MELNQIGQIVQNVHDGRSLLPNRHHHRLHKKIMTAIGTSINPNVGKEQMWMVLAPLVFGVLVEDDDGPSDVGLIVVRGVVPVGEGAWRWFFSANPTLN